MMTPGTLLLEDGQQREQAAAHPQSSRRGRGTRNCAQQPLASRDAQAGPTRRPGRHRCPTALAAAAGGRELTLGRDVDTFVDVHPDVLLVKALDTVGFFPTALPG
jgi:hypothetical protein